MTLFLNNYNNDFIHLSMKEMYVKLTRGILMMVIFNYQFDWFERCLED